MRYMRPRSMIELLAADEVYSFAILEWQCRHVVSNPFRRGGAR